ncbi:hypothetical protein BST61_g7153 [Cercospora zeina]
MLVAVIKTNSTTMRQTSNFRGQTICDTCSLRMLQTGTSTSPHLRKTATSSSLSGKRMRSEDRESAEIAPSQATSSSPTEFDRSERDEEQAHRIFEDLAKFAWPGQREHRSRCLSPVGSERSPSPKSSIPTDFTLAELKASASHAGISSMNILLMQYLRDADERWNRHSPEYLEQMPGIYRSCNEPSSRPRASLSAASLDSKHQAANNFIAALDDDFLPTTQYFKSTGSSASDADSDVSHLDLAKLDTPLAISGTPSDHVEYGRRGAIAGERCSMDAAAPLQRGKKRRYSSTTAIAQGLRTA